MNENKALFETMPITQALMKLAIPTIINQMIMIVYNMADTFFVGMTNDPYKVAAISVAFVLATIPTALSNLFGIGGSTLISRLLGIECYEDARNVCAVSFYGSVGVAVVYSAACYIFMRPLLYLLGASDNTYPYAVQYVIWVVIIGSLPSIMSMTMSHLLRSEGFANEAGFGLIMGAVLHIILDPIFMFFVFEPGLEVVAVAVSAALSNYIAFTYYLVVFFKAKKSQVLNVNPAYISHGIKHIGSIIAVGIPSCIATLLSSVTNTIVNKLCSSYGDIAVAGMGIVKKVDMLPQSIGMGLAQGMMPLVAFNYSSKNYKRMKAAIRAAMIGGVGAAAAFAAAYITIPTVIIRIFIDDAETISLGAKCLRICCMSIALATATFQMSYALQAMGKGIQSLFINACKQGIVYIPLLYIFNAQFGLFGIAWAQVMCEVITIVISVFLFRKFTAECRETIRA